MMVVNLSFRRSGRLLASSQALAYSTTQRTVPSPEPCGSPHLRISGRMPSAAQSLRSRRCDRRLGIKPGDRSADHQGAAQQGGKQPCVIHIGGGGQSRERDAVARHNHMILGSALGPVGRGRSGLARSTRRRASRTRQLSLTTSQAAAAAPVPSARPDAHGVPPVQPGLALHSPRRRRSVAPQTRSPVARSSRHCMPSRQKHPQCFDHRRGSTWATMIAARPFNPVDRPATMPLSFGPIAIFSCYRTEMLGPGAILSSRCNARKLAIYRPPDFRKPP